MTEKVPLCILAIPVLPWLPHAESHLRIIFFSTLGRTLTTVHIFFLNKQKQVVKNARYRNIFPFCQLGDILILLIVHIWLWPF